MKSLKDYDPIKEKHDKEEEKVSRQISWVIRIVMLFLLWIGVMTMINQSIIVGAFVSLIAIGVLRLDYWFVYKK